jgi:poly [ADP-ribose] polymerase 2/3/4
MTNNHSLEDIGYNKDRLPLGKLGKNTLKEGFKHLQELASLIKHPSLAQNKYGMTQEQAIQDFTNRYYSTIPHISGRNAPPQIDNNDILRQEVAMLDTLTDMEVANTIMRANDKSKDAASISLLDKHFTSLNLKEVTPLSHTSNEYKQLAKYLLESSGSSHGIKYRLEDIFRIERTGEADRFHKSHWAKIKDKNRLLLWHGSRTTNYGGILSQGLRIAPPEAPMSGWAFGKGVYLADCSSKSANYCRASMSGGTGLLLLCEAELANPMYEIPTGNSNAQEEAKKKNCFSTKGVGRTVPQKWKDAGCVSDDLKGCMMPDGVPGQNTVHKGGYLL